MKDTLTERGSRYGEFATHARITQELKDTLRAYPGWASLTPPMREALEMILHKIGRILNGDPAYADSWHDIAGYARLVEMVLEGKPTVAAASVSPTVGPASTAGPRDVPAPANTRPLAPAPIPAPSVAILPNPPVVVPSAPTVKVPDAPPTKD